VSELYAAGPATAAGGLLVSGTLMLALATGLGSPPGARGGAVLLALGVVVESVQMLLLSRRRP
jgi:hypothetical protein